MNEKEALQTAIDCIEAVAAPLESGDPLRTRLMQTQIKLEDMRDEATE